MLWYGGEEGLSLPQGRRVAGHYAREMLASLNWSQFFSSPISFDGQMRRSKVGQGSCGDEVEAGPDASMRG